jgi:hypothetical protein
MKVVKADVCYESGHFLPPRKKPTDFNTFRCRGSGALVDPY